MQIQFFDIYMKIVFNWFHFKIYIKFAYKIAEFYFWLVLQLSKAPDSQLRCTKIRIVPEWYCRFAYRQSLREKNKLNEPLLCGGNHESDTCKGDSGSPAVLNQKLFGLVAGGDNCGSYVFPNIYTVVPRYYDWILKNVGSEADFVRQLSVKNETRRSFWILSNENDFKCTKCKN